jgi:ribosomal protein S18 acetylase RimI-like enzyme
VYSLLRSVNQSPSYEDFVSWLDEPTYEPGDRLLLKQGERIIAHIQLLSRMAWFEGVKVPISGLQDLTVLPEYSQAGLECQLLSAAEVAMRDAQTIVSIVRTERADAFRAAGWLEVRGQGHSEVGIGDLLAHLSAQPVPKIRCLPSVRIRRWRHVEMDAVRAVYTAAAAHFWGALYRPEPYWWWLVGRKAHSELIVAVEGDDDWRASVAASRIVGYAVTRGGQILELCCLPEFLRTAPRLLVRACQDAIEHDHHTLSLHTPPSDPLHELVVTAGGRWCGKEREAGATLLLKLLDPARWIEVIYPILRRRVKRAALARPLQMGFDCGDEQYRLLITRRSSRLIADEALPVDVRCDKATFSALLLGNLNIAKACDAGSLAVANADSLHRLTQLFPPSLFWQSPFDALRF